MVFLAAAAPVVVAFFAAALAVVFLAPVAPLAGFTTVVPDEVLEAVVPELILRSFCSRVAGLAGAALEVVALVVVLLARVLAALVVPLAVAVAPWGVGFLAVVAVLLVARALALSIIPARLAVAFPALTGLPSLSGEAGRDMNCCDWDGFSGEIRNGECGNVRELEDLGERIFD